jgi:hypothetical protein
MIEQIKQDLAEWDELVAKRPELKGRCGKWPEWVRGLIGEVERLEHRDRVVSLTNETLGRYVREGKEEISSLKLQNKELQKALEQIGNGDVPQLTSLECRTIARTALQSIQGGNTQ